MTARSWFFGTKPELDDRAPALVLRDAGKPADGTAVIAAARSFAAGGSS